MSTNTYSQNHAMWSAGSEWLYKCALGVEQDAESVAWQRCVRRRWLCVPVPRRVAAGAPGVPQRI